MKVFVCLASLLAVSCAHQTPVGQREMASLPRRVIDAHAHWDGSSVQPSKKMKDEFLPNQIVGAVVHQSRSHKDPERISTDSPLQFRVCAAVVPGTSVKEVERGLASGKYRCMKVYLGYVPRYATDAFYKPFYKLAEKTGVPVVFHTGDTYDKMAKVKFAEPLQVDEVAVEFPKVTFVIAHIGNPWINSAAEVVYKNDNVYADLSALLLDDISKETPETVEELVVKPIRWFYLYVENPKKLMFGTDWPLLTIRPYLEAVQRAIPKEHWDDVFYNNAVRVFKFDSK